MPAMTPAKECFRSMGKLTSSGWRYHAVDLVSSNQSKGLNWSTKPSVYKRGMPNEWRQWPVEVQSQHQWVCAVPSEWVCALDYHGYIRYSLVSLVGPELQAIWKGRLITPTSQMPERGAVLHLRELFRPANDVTTIARRSALINRCSLYTIIRFVPRRNQTSYSG
jgi:hypothetical protein